MRCSYVRGVRALSAESSTAGCSSEGMIKHGMVLVGEKNRHGDNFLLLLIIPAITPANRSSLGVILIIHHVHPGAINGSLSKKNLERIYESFGEAVQRR